VAWLLNPLVGRTPQHIKNSLDLVTKLKDFKLEEDESLISYDVSSLFTNVPVNESVEIIRHRLENDVSLPSRTSMTATQVADLLHLCLSTTYFTYNQRFYTQVEGAAMGSPVSPIVANLFMEHFENEALSSFHSSPRFWGRYVDDIIVIIKTCDIDPFTEHLNSLHPKIKFTWEMEVDRTIPMLDTLIMRKDDGTLSFKVYRKKTHTDQYLQFTSHQPTEHKLGVIRTLRHRANTIITSPEDKLNETNHLKKVLSVSGYPNWAWQNKGSRKINRPSNPDSLTSRPKRHITIPYVQGISEPLSRVMRRSNIMVHVRPHRTLRNMLVSVKDKVEMKDKCGVIYELACKACSSSYIGETERTLRKWIVEHKRESSPVGARMTDHFHQLEDNKTKVLDSETEWFKRGIREAI
jgi:hypothetical protein